MRNKNKFYLQQGFTLTEMLLAVMIVGLIGIALASLSRGAARESGVARSRIMLRNNAALFIRTLRRDLEQATRIDAVGGELTVSGANPVELIRFKQGIDANGNKLSVRKSDGTYQELPARYITYCFSRGSEATWPSSAFGGGTICRMASDEEYLNCVSNAGSCSTVLNHVKYIPAGDTSAGRAYAVPSIKLNPHTSTGALLDVRVITELKSTPVINDVMEETLTAPLGY